ncbi:uncharacterized protein LOC127255925 [Andrographis paniculata]|uniref:uncharacterized protein LOC127255925 n=1 Tax=Andrographis paniculata TaxID=175694 RepID=UPI0021E705E2|nr:uncharacterized protein LOC127255925 [Andrographis paniculata]
MKAGQNNTDKFIWESMRSSAVAPVAAAHGKALPKLMVWLILFVSATYALYTLKLVSSSSHASCDEGVFSKRHTVVHLAESVNATSAAAAMEPQLNDLPARESNKTGLEHIFFGIGASAKLWGKRKEYIKLWWKPEMRGIVWLESRVKTLKNEAGNLPELRISGDTSRFPYKNKQGHRSAIRISRIVSETIRLGGMDNVRWFVMGDDDTVFVTDNLVRILNKYDHNQFYYIGSSSESHLQNIYFSYSMAYGGGGFAISYPLAKALEKMQDRCIKRYPRLYGSDDRMQACMAELGIPLTKEWGFHQYDVYGNLFGLLAAHPVTPLVSLHHLDVVEPIFPNVTQVEALRRLSIPTKLDSAGLMQQSICYDKANSWTISVSWGFAVQIFRGVLSPREMEMPSRTFLNWYRRADYTAYAFNTRPFMRNPCQKPYVFYFEKASSDSDGGQILTEYAHNRTPHPLCKWKIADPVSLDTVVVFKKPDPRLWDRSPRRNCCRVMNTEGNVMAIDVGVCEDDEVSEV